MDDDEFWQKICGIALLSAAFFMILAKSSK